MLQEHKKMSKKTTKILLSATQTTAFMEDGSQMSIPHDTVDKLKNKGISVVADLIN